MSHNIRCLIASIIRLPFINEIYLFIFRILKTLKPNLDLPFIVNKKVKLHISTDCSFFVDPKGKDTIGARIYLNGIKDFESDAIPEFQKRIKNQNIFFDIGANTGIYSLIACSVNPNIQVHAFEPVPEVFSVLKNNARINGFKNLQCEPIALGDKKGNIEFDIPIGVNFPTSGSTNLAHRPNTKRISCSTDRLDDYCKERSIDRIDFIKMDTESTEPSVISGGINIIKKSKPTMIIEILNKTTGDQIKDLLSPLGYDFYLMHKENGLVACSDLGCDSYYSNYLFVAKDKA